MIQEELEVALAKLTTQVVCIHIQHVLLLLDLLHHTIIHA